MPPILRLLRPHQYAKNLLVFAAPGAAGRLDDATVVGQTLLAFALFCAVSSVGYVFNDLLDAEADRLHPKKKFRPIASREVSPQQARMLIVGLSVGASALAAVLGTTFLAVLVCYAAVSLSYSFIFKQIPWLELLFVSAGFVLRAVGGGAASDTPISAWFLMVVSAGALLVITGKRIGELVALGPKSRSRKVLIGYHLKHLQWLTVVAGVLAVAGYGTWAAARAEEQVASSTGSLLLRLTALPFIVAIARYLVLAWQGAGETPESLIVRDRIMLAAGACWTIVYAIGLYF